MQRIGPRSEGPWWTWVCKGLVSRGQEVSRDAEAEGAAAKSTEATRFMQDNTNFLQSQEEKTVKT